MTNKENIISLVSMESGCGKTAENLGRICAYMDWAAQKGAHMAVFPELALTGYCLKHAKDTAIPTTDSYVDVLRQSAQKCGITALVGMAEKAGDSCYITQLVCGSDGTLQVYRKTHLGAREQQVFAAGNELPVFQKENPFGIAICYDMHFPEVASTLRARGASLIAVPHASPRKAGLREEVWANYMPARAYDNRVYVACCNATGGNGCGTYFPGGLAVYAPDGGLAAADFSGEEKMITVEVPPMQFDGAKNFPLHRRPELYE